MRGNKMIKLNAKQWKNLMSLPTCDCEMCLWSEEESATKCTCFVNAQSSPCPFCRKYQKKWTWLTEETAQKILKERHWTFELKQPYTGWTYGMVGPHLESGFVKTVMGEGHGIRDAVYDALRKEETRNVTPEAV
jgi:hypothetical protein